MTVFVNMQSLLNDHCTPGSVRFAMLCLSNCLLSHSSLGEKNEQRLLLKHYSNTLLMSLR